MAARLRRRTPSFLVVIIAMLAVLCGYVGARLIPSLPAPATALLWAALASLIALPVLLVVRSGRPSASALAPVGFFVLLLSFTVLRDVVWLVALLLAALGLIQHPDTAALDATSGAVVALACITFAFGTVGARSGPTVVDVVVPVADLDPALDGFTIAQISDVHIGRTLQRPFMERVVAVVNAVGADVIAITGDLVDGTVEQLASHTEPLRNLRARHGAWFVTGNHDYYSGALPWIKELERLGVHVLLNAHAVLDHNGGKVVVGGVTDHSASAMAGHDSDPHRAIAGAPANAFKLLLAHQPATAKEAARAGFQLQLSGHTHGGQFFPGTLLAHLVFPFVAGLHRHGAMWVYTSRGTGWVGPPLRTTWVACEITRLTLVRGPSQGVRT